MHRTLRLRLPSTGSFHARSLLLSSVRSSRSSRALLPSLLARFPFFVSVDSTRRRIGPREIRRRSRPRASELSHRRPFEPPSADRYRPVIVIEERGSYDRDDHGDAEDRSRIPGDLPHLAIGTHLAQIGLALIGLAQIGEFARGGREYESRSAGRVHNTTTTGDDDNGSDTFGAKRLLYSGWPERRARDPTLRASILHSPVPSSLRPSLVSGGARLEACAPTRLVPLSDPRSSPFEFPSFFSVLRFGSSGSIFFSPASTCLPLPPSRFVFPRHYSVGSLSPVRRVRRARSRDESRRHTHTDRSSSTFDPAPDMRRSSSCIGSRCAPVTASASDGAACALGAPPSNHPTIFVPPPPTTTPPPSFLHTDSHYHRRHHHHRHHHHLPSAPTQAPLTQAVPHTGSTNTRATNARVTNTHATFLRSPPAPPQTCLPRSCRHRRRRRIDATTTEHRHYHYLRHCHRPPRNHTHRTRCADVLRRAARTRAALSYQRRGSRNSAPSHTATLYRCCCHPRPACGDAIARLRATFRRKLPRGFVSTVSGAERAPRFTSGVSRTLHIFGILFLLASMRQMRSAFSMFLFSFVSAIESLY